MRHAGGGAIEESRKLLRLYIVAATDNDIAAIAQAFRDDLALHDMQARRYQDLLRGLTALDARLAATETQLGELYARWSAVGETQHLASVR